MNKIALSLGLVCSLMLSSLSGCATAKSGDIQKDAARLENSSRELYTQIRIDAKRHAEPSATATAVSKDSEALIISTRDLNRAIERRATNENVLSEFERVSRDYKQLSASLAQTGLSEQNRTIAAEFDSVTKAYREVESSMSSRQSEVKPRAIPPVSSASAAPHDTQAYAEIERRSRLKDFWFP